MQRQRAAHFVFASELFESYLQRTEAKQTARVFKERARLLRLFAGHVQDLPIGEMIADDLEAWIEGNPDWASDWTRLGVAGTIKRPFNWAVKKQLIACNPFASVSYPTGPRGTPMKDADFRRLLRHFPALFRRVLLFMSWCGVRPCEIAALTWDCIDCHGGTATLTIHKTSRSRKDRAPRIIYLPAVAVRLLVWLRLRSKSPFVFTNKRGGPWNRNSFSLRVWKAKLALKIPMSVKTYGIRHCWATNLALNGVDVADLAELLGHTTQAMAAYYVHLRGHTKHLRARLESGLRPE